MTALETLRILLSLRRSALAACLAVSALACTDEGGEADDEGAVDEVAPELGDTPLPACDAALFAHEQLLAELALPEPDVEYIAQLYRGEDTDLSGESPIPGGSPLQRWVREVDARLGRVEGGLLVDDAAIEGAIDLAPMIDDVDERRRLLLTIRDVLRLVASLDVRARLATVADQLPDPQRDPALTFAEWDTAWCYWGGVLRPLAAEAGSEPALVDSLGSWETIIVDAFGSGHAGILGPEQAWAPDEYATKASKQIIEKTTFTTIHRVLLARASAAQGGDQAAADEALGLLRVLEDRILGRNSPAVPAIVAMLEGELASIDPAWIEAELAVAFVKRARKYCDEAVVAGTLGTPDGVKGAWEGIVYTAVVLPIMEQRLPGFDAAAHMQLWLDYLAAVEAEDGGAAVALTQELVAVNCATQAELGIAACTASEDESE